MASTDSNGIMRVDANDDVSPLFPVFNSLAQSVSNAFDANTRIWPVANEAGRTARVTAIGIGNISSAKPLFVWRANAATGRNLEYTVNGSVWFYYDSSADTASAKTWRVANEAGRTNIFTAVGPGSTTNPVMVWRADAPAGRQLEYNVTSNNAATNWHYVPTSQDDTGWLGVTMSGGWTSAYPDNPISSRLLDGQIFLAGSASPNGTLAANTWANIGSLNSAHRPFSVTSDTFLGTSSNTATSLLFRVTAAGLIQAWASTATSTWFHLNGINFRARLI